MRVLQIIDTINTGSGVASVVITYHNNLKRALQGEEEIIFDFMVNESPTKEIEEKIKKTGSKIYQMPPLGIKHIRKYNLELKYFFKNHKEYKIVHGHVPNAAAFYLRAAKNAGVPIRILHSHNSKGADSWWKRIRNKILSQMAIKQANCYFACGQKAARFLYGKTKKDITILPNAIEKERFEYKEHIRQEIREKYQLKNRYVIGHIGRFCPQKNQLFLVKIFKEIYQKDKTACLLLIGDGSEKNKVEKIVEQYGLSESVKFVGVVNHVEEYLQAMDVFVLPSKYEGVPIAALEAQAAELPCVLSTVITREIETEYTRYLDLKSNIQSWVDEILKWKGIRQGYLKAEYDIKQAVPKLVQKYREEIGSCQDG